MWNNGRPQDSICGSGGGFLGLAFTHILPECLLWVRFSALDRAHQIGLAKIGILPDSKVPSRLEFELTRIVDLPGPAIFVHTSWMLVDGLRGILYDLTPEGNLCQVCPPLQPSDSHPAVRKAYGRHCRIMFGMKSGMPGPLRCEFGVLRRVCVCAWLVDS